ncbi:VWA domain-containing protein [Actinomadura graeca]|uniref:VWA domain-containing protein n=1 Tax=Actinomadura graeca TaxID=2750812 RepID=A0ABX8QQN0_9ACTN|nr:vWA domain-containing protein [Actinomadura graeca]QXJ20062.1 VWA domain-containing protein [Actinomadura graeca]
MAKGPGESWPERVRENWIPLLGVSAPVAGGLAAAGGVQRFPYYLLAVFAALLLLDWTMSQAGSTGVLSQVGRLGALARLPRRRKPLGAALRRAAAFLGGAAVAAAGWIAVPQVGSWASDGCDPPPELRVMAAPENKGDLERAADRFVQEQGKSGGCVPVHVTVFEAPAPDDLLGEAFTGNWNLAQLPHPDIWLPATTAPVPVGSERGTRGPRLWIDGHYGAASPLVLAAPQRVAQDHGLIGPVSWAQIATALNGKGTRLLTADLETTESGLAGAFALFTGSTGNDEASRMRRRELVDLVNPDGPAPADPDDLLCGLRNLDPGPYTITAAIVPLASVEAYNSGSSCGGIPVSAAERLTALGPADQSPAVDRPIVRLRWEDDGDAGRDRYAGRFSDWLTRHGPERAGSPGSTLTPGRLAEGRRLRDEARKPLTLEFMLDMSGTMNAQVPGGTLLANARTLIADAVDRLGRDDRVGLSRFPAHSTGRDPSSLTAPAPVDEAQTGRIEDALGRLQRADSATTPLYHAIAHAAGTGTAKRTLVVLTDGVDDDPRHDGFSSARELRDALAGADGPQVYVLVLKGAGCGKDLVAMEHARPRFHCLGGGRTRDSLLHDLFSRL